MRKFLLFRVEKNGKLELIDVLYSSMLERVNGQTNKAIKQDLLLIPGMRKCCANSLIGECTDYESYAEFDNDELQILNTINHVYGYEDLKYLVLDLTHIQNINIENVTNYLKDRISSDLEGFKYYNFEEYVVLLGNNVFFVNNNTKLTDEETEYLRALSKPEQDSFVVFRNEDSGKLVVY